MRNRKVLKSFVMILLTLNASFLTVPVSLEAKEGKESYGKHYGAEGVKFEGAEFFAKGRIMMKKIL